MHAHKYLHFLTHIMRIGLGSRQASTKHPAYASFGRKFGQIGTPDWFRTKLPSQGMTCDVR